MKKTLRNWIMAIFFATGMGGGLLTLATPQTSLAACTQDLLTFPAWYKGIVDDACEIKKPSDVGFAKFVWTIALNVIEVMLQLVGYIAVAFIIVGGFKYMTSAGAPDSMTKAKNTILNAMIGLGISIASVAIVNLVSGAIN